MHRSLFLNGRQARRERRPTRRLVWAVVKELGIPRGLGDPQALIDLKPCSSSRRRDGSPDVITTTVPFATHAISAQNPLLNDLCERNTHVFPVGINPRTARRLGIQQSNTIARETEWGRRTGAVADSREGVHPQVVACVGILGRQIAGDLRTRGKGVHFNSLTTSSPDVMDHGSAALDARVRVTVRRAGRAARAAVGGAGEGPHGTWGRKEETP